MSYTERALSIIWTVWSFVAALALMHWILDKPLTWGFILSAAAGVTIMNLLLVAIQKAAGK